MAINPMGTLPPELYEQQQQLNRQQQMAQMLMQQGQQQPQGQMISGRYVAPSILQNIAPLVQTYLGTRMAEKGDKQALELATALRKRYGEDLAQYQNLMNPKQTELAGPTPTGAPLMTQNLPDRQAANLFAATSYNPALQAVGMKNLTQGPKWEKAELPNPDGSIRKGWVDYNSANPLSTFIEGGTKPAFNSLEAARFQYDTGMRLPTGNVQGNQMPINAPQSYQSGAMPTGSMPTGSMPPQMLPVTSGRGMSPAAMNEANKQVYVDVEKRRIENLEKSPQVIATITDTLRNVDDLIGDARIIKDAKGKEKIDYTVTQDGKQIQGRKPLAGFETAVGFGLPSYLTPAGSSASDFRVRLDQIKDRTFLQAFETLKGSGQITEKEGEKATSALNRMSTAQSEVEFIKAAREFEENLRTGMEMAKRKVGMPTSGPSSVLRWNPKTNSWQ
jgi:hypothetical protein